jgi:hypothetical protein
MTSAIFLRWLDHFASSLPPGTKRQVMLVYDGYGDHYNDEIVSKSIEVGVILVLLPANATHLVQPLDVSVFKPFKTVLKRQIEHFMCEHAATSLSKKDAVKIASDQETQEHYLWFQLLRNMAPLLRSDAASVALVPRRRDKL